MDDGKNAGDVDQAMEALPAAAQLTDRKAIRGERQQEENDERCHPDRDERPLADIHDHRRHVEVVDEHDPRQQMQRGIEEGEQPEHPPQLDEIVPPGDAAQRSDCERDREKGDRPGPGLVRDVVARVGSQRVGIALDERRVKAFGERRGGDQRRGEAENFDDRDRLQ